MVCSFRFQIVLGLLDLAHVQTLRTVARPRKSPAAKKPLYLSIVK